MFLFFVCAMFLLFVLIFIGEYTLRANIKKYLLEERKNTYSLLLHSNATFQKYLTRLWFFLLLFYFLS